jgi:hypothetical protein
MSRQNFEICDIKRAVGIVENLFKERYSKENKARYPKQKLYFSKKKAVELITAKIKAEYHYFLSRTGRWDKEKISQDLNTYSLKDNEVILSWLRQFYDIKQAIKKRKLVLSIVNNSGTQIKVNYIKNNEIQGISLTHLKALNNYPINYDKRAVSVCCYGTSRTLEVILSMAYKLGLTFEQTPQNQKVI